MFQSPSDFIDKEFVVISGVSEVQWRVGVQNIAVHSAILARAILYFVVNGNTSADTLTWPLRVIQFVMANLL